MSTVEQASKRVQGFSKKALLLKVEEGFKHCTQLRRFLMELPLPMVELDFRRVLRRDARPLATQGGTCAICKRSRVSSAMTPRVRREHESRYMQNQHEDTTFTGISDEILGLA